MPYMQGQIPQNPLPIAQQPYFGRDPNHQMDEADQQ